MVCQAFVGVALKKYELLRRLELFFLPMGFCLPWRVQLRLEPPTAASDPRNLFFASWVAMRKRGTRAGKHATHNPTWSSSVVQRDTLKKDLDLWNCKLQIAVRL